MRVVESVPVRHSPISQFARISVLMHCVLMGAASARALAGAACAAEIPAARYESVDIPFMALK